MSEKSDIGNTRKVSIVIPTHKNRAGMLEAAIKSILEQTYKDWEAIIVANGCTDNIADIVEGYLTDPRFKFINIREPIGGAKARNIGMDESKGEYLAFLDDDDEWLPEKLERQVEFLTTKKAAIISCSYYIYKDDVFCGSFKMKKHVRMADMLFENMLGSYSFCITKRAYSDGCRINEKLDACQDWDLWVKIMAKTKLDSYSIRTPLVRYHEHSKPRLTTAFERAENAKRILLDSHRDKMGERHKTYHALADHILLNKDVKHNISKRLKNTVLFLSVTNTMKPRVLYRAFMVYLFGIRLKKLKGILKSLSEKTRSIINYKERRH
jgi:glycosyltransferase involved in cell wall biosynthesis